ncbi:hypothetical protein B0H14DRAFT_2600689 [Mycena olivaceomarginata]|nr:hypothetical protein B0H14DRAFT_2600689 [Mycena olivaceomarginata]
MPLAIRRAGNKDRVLQYGTVAATLLKDIGNASNQPYLQMIASVSLLIMETVQRVKDNKDACMKMTEHAYELVCAIINICRDAEAELAPAMVRSITQLSETLENILAFVRNQVKGGLLRRMFRSMEDADLIKECNAGLKHALDVFGVQSGSIAAMTMAEMQKDAKQRHEELIAILNEKRSKKRSSSSGSDGSGSSRRKRSSRTDLSRSPSTVSMLPASSKIFYGRDEQVQHLTRTITLSKPARVAICGAEGLGKTAVALAASHSPEISQMFGVHRYFVECDGARDPKQLVAAIAIHLQLEGTGRKHVIRHLTALATEETPVLIVLDALDRAWKPYENRSDVEDFLSLLADLQHLTLIATVRGRELPHQVKWTRPFLPTLQPLPPAATRATFLDISDVSPDEPDLEELLEITENNPGTIIHMALLASFEGCSSLVARWHQEGPALLLARAERPPHAIERLDGVLVLDGLLSAPPLPDNADRTHMTTGWLATINLHSLARPLAKFMKRWQAQRSMKEHRGSPLSSRNIDRYLSYLEYTYVGASTKKRVLEYIAEKVISEEGDAQRVFILGYHTALRYLGDALLRRTMRLGDLNAINQTVAILRQATDLFPHPHPDGAWILKDLATSLLRRYEHNGDLRDILEARPVLKEALQRLPADHLARPSTLKVLGDVLLRRFEYLGDLDDIQEALPILSEAVNLSPGIDPNHNLGYCLVCRFQRLGDLKDIQDALVMFESSAACSDDCSFHNALRAVIPSISHFVHEEYDITARFAAVRVLATLASYSNLRDALGTAIPDLVFVLECDNDSDLKYETAVALECFMEYPSLQHLLVDDIPLIHAQLGRNGEDTQWAGGPKPRCETGFQTGNPTATSTQEPGIRHRGPPSKEKDFYHPSVSVPSLPTTHFAIPEVLRNYLRNVPFRLPCSRGSPHPNPIGGLANWGKWLTIPDSGRWLTKIWNYIGAAYLFVIAPPFVHDRTAVWDLERLGRRLGAFQTWVWAANAALFA